MKKMQGLLRATGLCLCVATVTGACTDDFGRFEMPASGGAGGATAVTGGRPPVTTGGTPPTGGTPSTGGIPGTGGSTAGTSGGGVAGTSAGGASAGAGAVDSGSAGAASTPDGAPCGTGEKLCSGMCVSAADPSNGCGAADCSPCATLDHATSACVGGACGLGACDTGFDDCNATLADGCEQPLDAPTTCGACGRACDLTNVTVADCTGDQCSSLCVAGFANCSQPATGADDGCELDARADVQNCGGCGNACPAGFACADGLCGCDADSDCRVGGGNPSLSVCDAGTGRCTCSGTDCAAGEVCNSGSCRCNGGAPCAVAETCCAAPAGCFDLVSDPGNCGVCGHVCPSGRICVSGACSAGTSGACDGGPCPEGGVFDGGTDASRDATADG